MADQSPNPAPQVGEGKPGKPQANISITWEQVQAIADRVYCMLLRDLKQEQERQRIAISRSGRFKGGW